MKTVITRKIIQSAAIGQTVQLAISMLSFITRARAKIKANGYFNQSGTSKNEPKQLKVPEKSRWFKFFNVRFEDDISEVEFHGKITIRKKRIVK